MSHHNFFLTPVWPNEQPAAPKYSIYDYVKATNPPIREEETLVYVACLFNKWLKGCSKVML